MNVVIDMNLSPDWVGVLSTAGHRAVHWSTVGSPGAPDRELLGWARRQGFLVFTHDLDFGAILAATEADAPSVLQIRIADPTPNACGTMVVGLLEFRDGGVRRRAGFGRCLSRPCAPVATAPVAAAPSACWRNPPTASRLDRRQERGGASMLSAERIMQMLHQQREYLAAEYGVQRIGLFGSYANGLATEDSDIDIVVEFDRPIGFRFAELCEHLEKLFGKPVDMLTPAGVKGIRVPRIAREIEQNIHYV